MRLELSGVIRALIIGLALLGTGTAAARATVLVDTVPFVFNTDGSQTVQLPQFDPALGTLTAATASLSALLQPLLEIFNTGRSQVDLAVQEFLNLGTLQARTGFSFGGFIPDNTPAYGLLFPPMPISASTSLNGQLAQFTGLGGLPFVLTLASPATIQQGPTVTGVSSSASANGTVTLDYTYTPAPPPLAVPEPAPLAVVGAGLLGLGLFGAPRRAGRDVHAAEIPGGPGGDRTHDPKIKSLVLYQLSYRPARRRP